MVQEGCEVCVVTILGGHAFERIGKLKKVISSSSFSSSFFLRFIPLMDLGTHSTLQSL
jgi:hypothetical protein